MLDDQNHPVSRRRLLQATPVLAVPAAAETQNRRVPLGSVAYPQRDSGIRARMREAASRLTIFDTHEHLMHEADRLKMQVDFGILFSNYTHLDLVSAGMAPGAVGELRKTEIPAATRWKSLAPYWPFVRTTGYGRCTLIAARDLYGVDDISENTYPLLSERIASANRPGLYRRILKEQARIERCVLDDLTTPRGEPLRPEPEFCTLVTRFDYLVMAANRKDLEHIEKVNGVAVQKLADVERAMEVHFDRALGQGLAGIKSGLAYQRSLDFDPVPRADAERAFDELFASDRSSAGPALKKQLQDYLFHKLMEHATERRLPVQIHTGLLATNASQNTQTNPSLLCGVLNRYPNVRFALFHGGYPYSSEFAAIAKNAPNVYPDLCWLHIISPGAAKRLLDELIETVPANKILGFGGDCGHVEGAYAHAQIARGITAEVLAGKVEDGYLTEQEAVRLLESILHQNGKDLFAGPAAQGPGEIR